MNMNFSMILRQTYDRSTIKDAFASENIALFV